MPYSHFKRLFQPFNLRVVQIQTVLDNNHTFKRIIRNTLKIETVDNLNTFRNTVILCKNVNQQYSWF